MTKYKVKPGHDQALNTLVQIDPQPKCPGIRPTLRAFSAAGTVLEQGPYVELIFSMLESVTSYQAVLTLFGLNAATSANVTVLVRDATFADVRMNGRAIRPVIDDGLSWSEYFPRDVVILVRDLAVAS